MQNYKYVLLPGWATTSYIWKELINSIDNSSSIVSLNWIDFLSESEGFINLKNSAQPIVIVAWSLGAMQALNALSRFDLPSVKAFICLSGTGRFVKTDNTPGARGRDLEAMIRLLPRAPEKVLHNFYTNILEPSKDQQQMDELMKKARCFTSDSLLSGLNYLRDFDLLESLNNFKTVTLILHGQNDNTVPLAAAELLNSKLSSSRLRVISGAGHALPLTHHQEVAGEIRSFLSELDNK